MSTIATRHCADFCHHHQLTSQAEHRLFAFFCADSDVQNKNNDVTPSEVKTSHCFVMFY
jgi:hypothetical protein